ncbi:hypothetical protein ASE14_16215 [Agromyces sp. Root81]|nr:hypothetical protein ASE14_16215 [Agromyces sp. Root81]
MAENMRRLRGLHLLILIGATTALIAGCTAPGDTEQGDDGASSASASAEPECDAEETISYVCGLQNAEDLVRVGTTPWLLASNLVAGGTPGAGKISLIDSEEKVAEEFFPGETPALSNDATMFPNCPSIDLEHLEVHGLSIRETAPGMFRLYATTHGAVEAIQAWEIDATGDKPQPTWVGCVPLPSDVYANSVAMLSDGGFVTTKFLDPTNADRFGAIDRGEVNGGVYEWHPGGSVTAVPGTELSGANGIEVSADERYIFVTAYGTDEIVQFDRSASPAAKVSTPVDIAPDNLRWTEDGTLLVAGVNSSPGTGWSVFEITPSDLTATKVAGYPVDVWLQKASTALAVDDEVWIGTWSGDRVGYYPAP